MLRASGALSQVTGPFRNHHSIRWASLVFTVVLLAPRAAGSTIVTTFGPGQSYETNSAWGIGSFSPQFPELNELAMSFTPSADYKLDLINVAVGNLSGPNQLTVYLTSGALPGASIESFSFEGLPGFPGVIVTATSTQHPMLLAGTQYWIVLSAADLSNTQDMALTNDQGIVGFFSNRTSSAPGVWTPPCVAPQCLVPAFEVSGTGVPEPSAISLVGLALAAAACIGRRKAPPL